MSKYENRWDSMRVDGKIITIRNPHNLLVDIIEDFLKEKNLNYSIIGFYSKDIIIFCKNQPHACGISFMLKQYVDYTIYMIKNT